MPFADKSRLYFVALLINTLSFTVMSNLWQAAATMNPDLCNNHSGSTDFYIEQEAVNLEDTVAYSHTRPALCTWNELSPVSDTEDLNAEQRGVAIIRLVTALLRAQQVLAEPGTPEKIKNFKILKSLRANLDRIAPQLRTLRDCRHLDPFAVRAAALTLYDTFASETVIMRAAWGNAARVVGALYPAMKEESTVRRAIRSQFDPMLKEDFVRGVMTRVAPARFK